MSVANIKIVNNSVDEKLQNNIIWRIVQKRLCQFYGDAVYDSWLSSLVYVHSESGKVVFSVPTRFIKEWILVHYLDQILKYWQDEDRAVYSIELCVPEQPSGIDVVENNIAEIKEINNNYDHISSPLDPRFTFENFVVGKPNELAFAAAKRVSESLTPISGSNPLFLYGGVGLGKTHLMHAIAWAIINSSSTMKVAYLSAEKFMYQYVRALRDQNVMMFKEQFRSVDVLMIDDVQFISGKDSTQEEFFHTFNALIDQNKQLVISADRSPSDLDGVKERIKSRLGWGLVADINDTTFELRLGILQLKVEKMSINVPDKVLEFLAKNIKSNIRELEGALNKVVAHSRLVGRSINLESANDILSDLLRANQKVVTIEDIQKKVAQYFNIKISDMHSVRRLRSLVRPRQIAMYLSKSLTQKSLPDIGKSFGGRDHATVIHSIKQIEKLMKSDAQLEDTVNFFIKTVSQKII